MTFITYIMQYRISGFSRDLYFVKLAQKYYSRILISRKFGVDRKSHPSFLY